MNYTGEGIAAARSAAKKQALAYARSQCGLRGMTFDSVTGRCVAASSDAPAAPAPLPNPPAASRPNYLLYAGIGVGVLAVGGMIYMMTK